MSQRKRQEKKRAKTLEQLEHGLAARMVVRAHHQSRLRALDVKIAASEAEIQDLKEESEA